MKRLFESIPPKENPKPRLVYKIENNDRPLYAKLIDKEFLIIQSIGETYS